MLHQDLEGPVAVVAVAVRMYRKHRLAFQMLKIRFGFYKRHQVQLNSINVPDGNDVPNPPPKPGAEDAGG